MQKGYRPPDPNKPRKQRIRIPAFLQKKQKQDSTQSASYPYPQQGSHQNSQQYPPSVRQNPNGHFPGGSSGQIPQPPQHTQPYPPYQGTQPYPPYGQHTQPYPPYQSAQQYTTQTGQYPPYTADPSAKPQTVYHPRPFEYSQSGRQTIDPQQQDSRFKIGKQPPRLVLWIILAVMIITIGVIRFAWDGNADIQTASDSAQSAQSGSISQVPLGATATITPSPTPTVSPTAAPTVTPSYSTLSEGSSGTDVKDMQERLIELGYLEGDADGEYGSLTAAAVTAFQTQHNLSSTGIADAETLSALYASTAEAAESAEAPLAESTDEESTTDTLTGDTLSQESAVASAQSYLSLLPYSYEGLIAQLEDDGYSYDDAVYAADSTGADWAEQALLSAQYYLETLTFSYDGLVAQLEYLLFTEEQAVYAVDNCGADWYEQAAESAEDYCTLYTLTSDELTELLYYEGFTDEEIAYALEENGY